VLEHEPAFAGPPARFDAHADEQLFVAGIAERFELLAALEAHRRLVEPPMEPAGRPEDDLARRVVDEDQRSAGGEDRQERLGGRRRSMRAGQPRRQVAQLAEEPRQRHVGERDTAKGVEDGLGRGADADGDAVTELGAGGERLEGQRLRDRQSMRHDAS
jgi:hypothetical protein